MLFNEDIRTAIKKIQDESVDLIVSDIPYKIIAWGTRIVDLWDEYWWVLAKRDYSKTDPKWCLNRWKIEISTNKLWERWIKEEILSNSNSVVKWWKMFDHNDIKFNEYLWDLYRVLKKWTHCYLMVNARNLKDLQTEAEKVWFVFQQLLVWNKTNTQTPNKYYMNACEYILMLSKRPARNINNMWSKNIIQMKNIVGNKQHPTEKPVELIDIFILNSSNEWDIVLDPFMWIWSTIHSARLLNRNYIWIEIDKKYFDICINLLNLNYEEYKQFESDWKLDFTENLFTQGE